MVGLSLFDIGYVNVYFILMFVGDVVEIVVMNMFFEGWGKDLVVLLFKFMFGYFLGVVGVVEVVVCV